MTTEIDEKTAKRREYVRQWRAKRAAASTVRDGEPVGDPAPRRRGRPRRSETPVDSVRPTRRARRTEAPVANPVSDGVVDGVSTLIKSLTQSQRDAILERISKR